MDKILRAAERLGAKLNPINRFNHRIRELEAINARMMTYVGTNFVETAHAQTLVPDEYTSALIAALDESLSLPGDVVECGVYKGGTLCQITRHIISNRLFDFWGRQVIGIDTFAGHISTAPEIAHKHWIGRFSDTSFESVSSIFNGLRFVSILKGDCRALDSILSEKSQFCFAHIDVDVPDAAIGAAEYIFPRLSVGGKIVFDEWHGYPQAEPLTDYFRTRGASLTPRTGRAENYGMIITKHRI